MHPAVQLQIINVAMLTISSLPLQHPEAGYNLVNSPHLRPAYALDSVLYKLSLEICRGEWAWYGVHPTIQSEHDIDVSLHYYLCCTCF